MKKLTFLILALLAVCIIPACSSSSSDKDDDDDERESKSLVKKCHKATDKIYDDPSDENLRRGVDVFIDAIEELDEEPDKKLYRAAAELINAVGMHIDMLDDRTLEKLDRLDRYESILYKLEEDYGFRPWGPARDIATPDSTVYYGENVAVEVVDVDADADTLSIK